MSNEIQSFIQAVKDGDIKTVNTLLDRGVNGNVIHKGKSALYIAVEKGYSEITEQLIKYGYGACPNNPTWGENSPLHVAVKTRNKAMVQLLLNSGADVNAKGIYCLPLHYTINDSFCETDKDLFNMLMCKGADIYARDRFDETCMHTAAFRGYADALEFLLQYDFDVNSPTSFGDLPLHQAARYSHVKIIQFLVDNGAYVNATDPVYRNTAIHCAVLKDGENVEAVILLLKLGADLNLVNHLGETPFQCVRPNRLDQCEILRVLTSHVVRLVTINSYVCYENLTELYSCPIIENLQRHCKTEIQDMKRKKIKNTNISFFDVFTRPMHILSHYVRNENVFQLYESEEIKANFPINADTLNYCLYNAIRRRDIISQCVQILSLLSSKLSPNDLDIICSYLTEKDLKNLISAYQHKL